MSKVEGTGPIDPPPLCLSVTFLPYPSRVNFEILKKYCDIESRFIRLDIKTNDNGLTLADIYAPNKDDPEFF